MMKNLQKTTIPLPGIMLFLACTVCFCNFALGQSPKQDYTSKVPKFRFPTNLEDQEAELKSNPLMLRFHQSRKELSSDPYRPIYHYVNPEGNLNDPNGLCFWNGNWHMFYQAYPPEDTRQHWGHAISKDLIHWRDLPYAIYPDPEYQCFQGRHSSKITGLLQCTMEQGLETWLLFQMTHCFLTGRR